MTSIGSSDAPAVLVLEDGRIFDGVAAGARGTAIGEVVFNTAMSGYQETLTDPSYLGQIVVMTASHVGNYGFNREDPESNRIQVTALAARHFPARFSNARGEWTMDESLSREGISGIHGLDTRALVRHIRSKGAMRGAVSSELVSGSDRERLLELVKAAPPMSGAALGLSAGTRSRYESPFPASLESAAGPSSPPRVAAIDYGIKRSILKRLAARGLAITVFPADAGPDELLNKPPSEGGFDGFFLSNGPGDPAALPTCVATVRALADSGRPVFGICLGHQLLGLALGAETFKLKFGHRGINHPVRSNASGEVSITSQNHGFAVKGETLPPNAEVTHVNLNDGSCEGFRVRDRPIFAVQYHPESSPGPHDSDGLFTEFAQMVRGG